MSSVGGLACRSTSARATGTLIELPSAEHPAARTTIKLRKRFTLCIMFLLSTIYTLSSPLGLRRRIHHPPQEQDRARLPVINREDKGAVCAYFRWAWA